VKILKRDQNELHFKTFCELLDQCFGEYCYSPNVKAKNKKSIISVPSQKKNKEIIENEYFNKIVKVNITKIEGRI
jgi:hypothetical protein